MRRLIALSAVAAALSIAPASHASYVGSCTGQVDTDCQAWICQGNCFQRYCKVWVNVVPGAPLCIAPVA